MYDGAVALDDEIIWGGSPLVLVLNYRVERAFTDNCCRTDMGNSTRVYDDTPSHVVR